LSRQQNLFDAFNLFKKPILNFYFYRPFSTQLFWYLGQTLFGLFPLGYHIINFVFFSISIFLVYKLALLIFHSEKVALLSSFFYGYATSHFYRLFFLSQFQEISLAVFTFLTLIFFLKRSIWTPVFFLLALTTKETAVMIVPMMLITIFLITRANKNYFILFFYCLIVLLIYFFGRVFFFGFTKGGVYEFIFNPRLVINNLFWYGLWSLGLPEAFVNVRFFKLPTILNPELFINFKFLGSLTLGFFGLFILSIFFPVITIIKKFDRKILYLPSFFICFLLPVLFFPFHKFPYSLAVPLFGVSLLLAYATSKLNTKYLIFISFIYISLSVASYQFNLSDHWVIKKAYTAKTVFDYFEKYYPKRPDNVNVYFRNNAGPYCLSVPKNIRSYSQEVSYALGGMEGLRLFYNDKNLLVYFEDMDRNKHLLPNCLVTIRYGW